jgi:sec-independent protein translocase protein TatB
MFDIGWPEMLVIAVVLIVVVGPKDLPKMLRTFGKTTSSLRKMAGDFRKQFDEALKEAELDDVKSTIDAARKLNPAADIRKALNPMERAASEVRAGLDGMMKSQPPKVPSADAPAMPAEPAKAGPAAMPGEPAAVPPAPVPAAETPAAAAAPASEAAPAAKATTAPAAKAATVKPAAAKAAAPRQPAKASTAKQPAATASKSGKPAASATAKAAPRKAPAAKKPTGAAS